MRGDFLEILRETQRESERMQFMVESCEWSQLYLSDYFWDPRPIKMNCDKSWYLKHSACACTRASFGIDAMKRNCIFRRLIVVHLYTTCDCWLKAALHGWWERLEFLLLWMITVRVMLKSAGDLIFLLREENFRPSTRNFMLCICSLFALRHGFLMNPKEWLQKYCTMGVVEWTFCEIKL